MNNKNKNLNKSNKMSPFIQLNHKLLGRGIKEIPSISMSAAHKYGKAHEKENILVTKYKKY
jgi:hypothetical protein